MYYLQRTYERSICLSCDFPHVKPLLKSKTLFALLIHAERVYAKVSGLQWVYKSSWPECFCKQDG